MNKDKTPTLIEVWKKQDAICAILLLAFQSPFKYDYTIPRPHLIINRIKSKINELEICESLKQKILEVTECRSYEESSILDHYMNNERFQSEWFYLWGDVYTWRKGEERKSLVGIKDIFTEKEKFEVLDKVHEMLEIQTKDYLKEHTFWKD